MSWYAFYRIEKIRALLVWGFVTALAIGIPIGFSMGILLIIMPFLVIGSFVFWAYKIKQWSIAWNERPDVKAWVDDKSKNNDNSEKS